MLHRTIPARDYCARQVKNPDRESQGVFHFGTICRLLQNRFHNGGYRTNAKIIPASRARQDMTDQRPPTGLPDLPQKPRPLPETPPWDTPLCELSGFWLDVHCSSCHHTVLKPLRLMAAELGWQRTLREVVPRLSCKRCKGKPSGLSMTDDAAGSRGRHGAVSMHLDLLGERGIFEKD